MSKQVCMCCVRVCHLILKKFISHQFVAMPINLHQHVPTVCLYVIYALDLCLLINKKIIMVTFEKGIFDSFSGKVGNVVGTTWRRKNVMRS